ncbi:MAG TPA: hypothetical protein VGK23_00115 [Methanomassiliicoccales archaeon]|jgi:hypothetical protein
MFIGHFAVAFILIYLFPGVDQIIPLVGVAFPDLLWPFLIFIGLEKVEINKETALQKEIKFTHYPFSHSLVIGTAIACIPGLIIALLVGPIAGIVFVVASSSHWVLDIPVHMGDLPVLGWGKDRKVGLGLWGKPIPTFIMELAFYIVATVLFLPMASWPAVIAIGLIFHMMNINSVLGLSRTNPSGSPRSYAALALVGFGLYISAFTVFIGKV